MSFEVSWAAPMSKRILVSDSAMETGSVAVVDQLADFRDGLARDDHTRQVRCPSGSATSAQESRWPSVATARSRAIPPGPQPYASGCR